MLRLLIAASQRFEPGPQTVSQGRRRLDVRMGSCYRLPRRVVVRRVSAGGVPAEMIVPPSAKPGRTLYYIHGGGFHMGSCQSHRGFVARMADAVHARGFQIDYRLVPEHPFPAAVEDCAAAYRWLVEVGAPQDDIVLAGESVGGGLVLTTLFAARDAGVKLPRAGVCISPVTDGTLEGSSYISRARRDVLINQAYARWIVSMYAGDVDLRLPLLSPLYGDYRDLPPLLIVVGGDEVLLDDSTRLAARAREAGVDTRLSIWPGMWHAFPLTPFLPEGGRALREIRKFVVQAMAGAARIPQFS